MDRTDRTGSLYNVEGHNDRREMSMDEESVTEAKGNVMVESGKKSNLKNFKNQNLPHRDDGYGTASPPVGL